MPVGQRARLIAAQGEIVFAGIENDEVIAETMHLVEAVLRHGGALTRVRP